MLHLSTRRFCSDSRDQLKNLTTRSANTKVGGRFGMKRCGPSCRHTRNASAVFKIFRTSPEKELLQQYLPEAEVRREGKYRSHKQRAFKALAAPTADWPHSPAALCATMF